jgi:hypothetical protein
MRRSEKKETETLFLSQEEIPNMKHSSYLAATLWALLISIASAEDWVAGDLGKAPFGKVPAARIAASASDWGSSNNLRQVLVREFTIAPGASAFAEWFSDLSGSERVGISVTTASDPRSRLTNVRIGVAFAAPGEWYIVSDVILCSSFYYSDHGGVTVPVYGPRMKVVVSNDGSAPVRITQLAAYAVAH